jgi:hypothetical protein
MLAAFDELRPDMPIGQVRAVLWTALHEGSGVADVAKGLGMLTGTASRSLADWYEIGRHKQPSFHFLEGVRNWQDKRVVKNYFTHKGRKFIKVVLEKLHVVEEGLE